MKFFMLYSNQIAVGNKPVGIASLSAILKAAGHEFRLFDCTAYNIQNPHKIDWNRMSERVLAFEVPANVERMPERIRISYRGLIDEVIKAVDEYKPDIIGLSALTDDYPLGLGLMREVKNAFPSIPTIAGGIHPTVDPEGVIREACFDMVCVGEGEYVVLDIAERIEQGKTFENIPNLWVKQPDGRVLRQAVRPYETNLDVFPSPDWTIFPEVAFFKPYREFVYKTGDFEMSRGCPYKCSYCINVELQQIYRGHQYHREKSIPRVIAEIKEAVERYQCELLKFWDETFLLMSKERMEEFGDRYSSEIGLPYLIETTAQSIDERSAAILRKTNCLSVSLGMETGSPDLRKGMLSKPTANATYMNAFALLEKNGVRKVSLNMIGLPTESQADIFRTIALNRLVRTDAQAVGMFYPYKGTPIRQMMISEGWMDEDFDVRDLKDYDYNSFTSTRRSVVRFKDMDSRLIIRLRILFAMYVLWPPRLHALLDVVKNTDDQFAATLLQNIDRVSYFKRFGKWAPGTPAARPARQMPSLPVFDDAEADEYAQLLVSRWEDDGLDTAIDLLHRIAAGDLEAEFKIPSDPSELSQWLETSRDTPQRIRETQKRFMTIAKADTSKYHPEAAL